MSKKRSTWTTRQVSSQPSTQSNPAPALVQSGVFPPPGVDEPIGSCPSVFGVSLDPPIIGRLARILWVHPERVNGVYHIVSYQCGLLEFTGLHSGTFFVHPSAIYEMQIIDEEAHGG